MSVDDDEEVNDYPNGINPYFNNSGFNYMNLLKNMGSTLIYLALMASAFILLALTRVVQIVIPKANAVTIKLKRLLLWNTTIRFVY